MTRRRRALLLAVAGVLLALGADLARPPGRQVSAWLLLGVVHLHQRLYAPLLARLGARCRFEPSCSRYADAVVRRFGAGHGGALALWRVLRCGPWTPAGTPDPPPGAGAQPASSLR